MENSDRGFVAEDMLSVCLVSERWIVDDRVYYPTHASYKTHEDLISQEEPDDLYQEYEFALRKICGLYRNQLTVLTIDWFFLFF